MVSVLGIVDPELDVEVVRLVDGREGGDAGWPVNMEIDSSSPVSITAAARHLNHGDLVVLQHEFGIYGGPRGESVLELVDQLDVPVMAVLHTVVPEPGERQRSIIESLARRATLAVMCEAARDFLDTGYSISGDEVLVIPHGAHWEAQPVNPPPRREVITWGLLGPGKGLERAIEAMGTLSDLTPLPRYTIVGRTHPAVVRTQGFAYRNSLHALVDRLGLAEIVNFVDRYVDDDELFSMVRRSDLVVVPYDNADQVSSGVITEALGMGRPVVATRFPFAVEALAGGAGLAVDHNVAALAAGIRSLLEDQVAYRAAARQAAVRSDQISWETVARHYSRAIHALAPVLATA